MKSVPQSLLSKLGTESASNPDIRAAAARFAKLVDTISAAE